MIASVLLLTAGFMPAKGAVSGLERVWVGSAQYVRLSEWAESLGFKVSWLGKNDLIELRGHGGRLEFAPDSRKSFVDGVSVWLSMPVINRNMTPLISLTDVETTLEPILFPHKSGKPLETVCIDAGHGGKDGGETDRKNFEKTYTLLLARELASLLKEAGFRVVLTRSEDQAVDLAERPAVAYRHGADLFVSLHYNSASAAVRGVEVYCLTPAGVKSTQDGGGPGAFRAEEGNAQDHRNVLLAWHMQQAITHTLPLEDRGLKRARYEVLCKAQMPAILIEGGFMTDPSDAYHIYDPKFRKRMAQAITEGIVKYKESLEPKPKLAGLGPLPSGPKP
jgi:N-acetylmuramoyl-L-alanine amidase